MIPGSISSNLYFKLKQVNICFPLVRDSFHSENQWKSNYKTKNSPTLPTTEKKLIYTPNSNKADFISHSPIISIHPIQTWKIKDIMQKGFFLFIVCLLFSSSRSLSLASSTLRHSFSSYSSSSSSSSLDALCCFSVLQYSFESDLGFWLQHEFVFVCLEMIRIFFCGGWCDERFV